MESWERSVSESHKPLKATPGAVHLHLMQQPSLKDEFKKHNLVLKVFTEIFCKIKNPCLLQRRWQVVGLQERLIMVHTVLSLFHFMYYNAECLDNL